MNYAIVHTGGWETGFGLAQPDKQGQYGGFCGMHRSPGCSALCS